MTPHPARWPQRLVFSLLILFTAAGLWMNHAAAPVAQAAPTPNAFGPTLFLVSAPPERADELFALAHPHARLSGDQPRFIASGSPDDLVKLADAGFAVQLLDQRTAGQVYYFVDLQEAGLPDDRSAKTTQLATLGRVLWADETEALIALDSSRERSFVDAAPAQDLHLSLLAPDFLAPTLAYDPSRSPTRLAVLQPNSFVTTLLDQVSSAQISTRIADLSGAQPVSIYGTNVTLNSRYTFATRIRDAERYLYQFYEQRGMAVRYDDWTYGSYSGRNIIAEIPGTLHPERIWLVGGHFDSISQDPYNSAPGADDNGSGTAATLMIAEILRQVRLGDTVHFVHFSGEEQGQWGSKSYARSLALAGAQVMGYIDLDMIGWDGNSDRVMEIHTGTGQGSNDLGTMFVAANAVYNQQLVIERKSTSASRFSDHSPFWDNGFPAFLAIENFFVDAIPNDRNPWYHNTGDSLSRVDLSYVVRHAKVALAVLAEQAGAFTGPTPTPTNTPTATPTPQPTNTPAPTATTQPGCTDLILNGGFETGEGWSFGPTPLQAGPVTSPVLVGSRALRLGAVDPASTAYSHSSAYQRVAIPAGATTVSLSFSQRPGPSADGTDYREILLLNDNLSFLRTLDRSTAPGSDTWQARQFDLMGERGKTVVVYFNVFNNGSTPTMVNYVDQVSLTACVGVTATPTATATSPATPIPTFTPTSTPTSTPTNQPINTATPTPTPSATPMPTNTPTSAPTSTPTPQ
ncbi:MAG: M20/M25/M40 family metallo-hydrolase, partial [Caldilineaceae bacterium]|nr:M20/M25/M40 family metallo-hydrolase [Caldilineaceae bacterium]